MAISSCHPLAGRETVEFAEIATEPFAACLPRLGWPRVLAGHRRRVGRPARVAAEVTSADEVFEAVSSGAAVTLLAEGNAVVYRLRITCIPVPDLEPAQLAVAWRQRDRRPAVRDFIRTCHDAAADRGRSRASEHT